ncbi:MAG: GntR family transcriptional regulator [Fluviicola sp.]
MIQKITYRDQVRILILDKMKSGEFKSGDTLSIAKIARELEVSVTPIREALTQLEYSGIIKSVPNRGFIIPELSTELAIELYELVASLEVLAVENSQFSKSLISQLEEQQKVIEKSTNAIDRIKSDMHFHTLLTSQYDNKTAQQMLLDLKTRIFFYEMEFMKSATFHEVSENHHYQIIDHLKNGQIEAATRVIKANWLQILNHINLDF